MPLTTMRQRTATILFLAAAIASTTYGQSTEIADWNGWRGPNRDGTSVGAEWPDSLADDRLKQLWRVELGPSYSGPIVVGGRVYTTQTVDRKTEVVTAYDLQSGQEAWKVEWPGAMQVPFFAAANGSWIRATPCADEKTLYVVGIQDVLVALDLATGAERWRIDFPKDHNTPAPRFGAASSPMIVGDALFAQMGGGFTKVDKRTSKIRWTVAKDDGGMSGGAFSSPSIAEINGQRIALVQTRTALKGITLDEGQELWSQPIQAFRGMNIMTPTPYGNQLFTSAHSGRSQLWQVGAGTSEEDDEQLAEVWNDKSQAYMSSPVIVGDHLYLHLKNQRVQCVNLKTGEEAWRSRPFGKYQSMVVRGDKILALDSGGKLLLLRATPEAFTLLDSRKLSDDETWAHLAIAGDLVVVRELNALAVYRWQ